MNFFKMQRRKNVKMLCKIKRQLNYLIGILDSYFSMYVGSSTYSEYLRIVSILDVAVKKIFGIDSEQYLELCDVLATQVNVGNEISKDKLSIVANRICGMLDGLIFSCETSVYEKRYQFFISSTYRDLKDQREIIANAIIKSENFYIGMENFHAISQGQLAYIEKNIRQSDYYILVVGSNYGSIIENKEISYTEFEFNLARKYKKPILFFLCSNTEILSQVDYSNKEKLERFVERVKAKANPCYFSSNEELEIELAYSISNATKENPQRGWIRG